MTTHRATTNPPSSTRFGRPHLLRAGRSALAVLLLLVVAGCGTTQPVGPVPGGAVVPAAPSDTPSATPGLKLNISIDSSTVSPSGDKIAIHADESVVLVTRSDHDVTLKVQGAGIDKTVFVDRMTTITTAFVVAQSGTVTITSSSPAATIAELTVS
ncbi:MAG: hypothetical protein ACR2LI_11840 [Propionibacteriaceae bacterium]